MNEQDILEEILKLPSHEQQAFLDELNALGEAQKREELQVDFMKFAREMWPGFVDGRHHKVMAKKFEEIASGKLKRLIICLPPRHTKSEMGSYLLPAWFLGQYPDKKIIQCSNTAELAVGFGRKVRNLIASPQYSNVFPGVNLRQDSKAAGRWDVGRVGSYYAIGKGGAVTGRGADLLIIDDPFTEQEAAQAVHNPEVFDSTYEWYTSGPRQRLQPGGAIVVIMCMTGDTPVLMADGYEKPLRDIVPGDLVATYENGCITTTVVNNWRLSGVDSIYKIQTRSGRIVRANERHPFLVDCNGELKWKKLKDLRTGDLLVSLKDVVAQQTQKQNPVCANLVWPKLDITKNTQMPRITKWDIMGNGKVFAALWKGVKNLSSPRVCVNHIAIKSIGPMGTTDQTPKKDEQTESKVVTESQNPTISACLKNKMAAVLSAISLRGIMSGRTGVESCVSTTVTTPEKSEDCYATTATLLSDTEKPKKRYSKPLNTLELTRDAIVSIAYAGEEDVYDVEIDRTENFIANGLVSHNTRWSKRDLVGRILKASAERDENDEWEVIEFPAILPSGKPLWPEFWSLKELEALKSELPITKWNAQYMQQPSAEEGAIIKREWWRIWDGERPPPISFTLVSWDTAFEAKTRSDYSACTVWGIFYMNENPDDPHIILLDAHKKRMEFPELKQRVLDVYKEWTPDCMIIEKKASGAPLIYELRRMGIPVDEFTPTRGNDKIVRLNAISDLFASGKVWAPPTRWAEEVIEEIASFPFAENDDMADSTSMALNRFRRGGLVRTNLDEQDEPISFRRKASYY